MQFSLTTIIPLISVFSLGSVSATDLVDIPNTAINAGGFTTLVVALSAADLVETLSGDNSGPFTVFAPTDDAFLALPDGLVGCLLEPSNKKTLADILTYHVANGKVLSTDLKDGQEIKTLYKGKRVEVDIKREKVMINDATVIAPNVLATNGVIHGINQVLVPPRFDFGACSDHEEKPSCTYNGETRPAGQYLTGPTHTCLCTSSGHWTDCHPNSMNSLKTIEEVIVDSDNLSTLEAAVRKAGLLGVLNGFGLFTLFAPTDRAFSKVNPKLLDFLLADGNRAVLAQVLQYHIYSGEAKSGDLSFGSSAVPTLLGGIDVISVDKTCFSAVESKKCADDTFSITLNDSSYVVAADVDTANGIIHVIEEVLIPPSLVDAVAGIIG